MKRGRKKVYFQSGSCIDSGGREAYNTIKGELTAVG